MTIIVKLDAVSQRHRGTPLNHTDVQLLEDDPPCLRHFNRRSLSIIHSSAGRLVIIPSRPATATTNVAILLKSSAFNRGNTFMSRKKPSNAQNIGQPSSPFTAWHLIFCFSAAKTAHSIQDITARKGG